MDHFSLCERFENAFSQYDVLGSYVYKFNKPSSVDALVQGLSSVKRCRNPCLGTIDLFLLYICGLRSMS